MIFTLPHVVPIPSQKLCSLYKRLYISFIFTEFYMLNVVSSVQINVPLSCSYMDDRRARVMGSGLDNLLGKEMSLAMFEVGLRD